MTMTRTLCRASVLAIALVDLSAVSGSERVEQQGERGEAAADREQKTGEELSRAGPVAPPPEAPVADYPADDQADEERGYAADDLQAQQVMSFWTRIMGLTGLGALLLSAIGVWLIKRTFDETRRASEAARDTVRSFKDAERGDLSVEVGTGRASETSDVIHYWLTAKNTGRSRVKITGVAAAPLTDPTCPDGLEIRNFVETWVEAGKDWVEWRGFDGPQDISRFPYMGGFVRYRDRFGDEHRSHFCVSVRQAENKNSLSSLTAGKYTHKTEDCLRERDWPRDT